jgi:hypothetical protein
MKRAGRIAWAAAAYGTLWLATALLGTRQVENDILATLEERLGPSSTVTPEEVEADPERNWERQYPSYDASAYSPVPFLLIVDWGFVQGPLMGAGYRGVYVWVFGWRRKLGSGMTWIS